MSPTTRCWGYLSQVDTPYRAILTPIGAVLAAGLIVYSIAAGGGAESAEISVVAAGALGGGLAYFLGWGLDAKIMHIKVVGDPPQTETTVNSPAQP